MKFLSYLTGVLSLAQLSSAAKLYVGSNANGNQDGIFVFDLNTNNGNLRRLGSARSGSKPNYLAIKGDHLYTNVEDEGKINAFAINGGNLRYLNSVPSSGGPAHIALDQTGKIVMVSAYGGGTVSTFSVGQNGRLDRQTARIQHHGNGPKRDRQQGPHAHLMIPDPQNRFAIAVDLGTDQVYSYPIDANRNAIGNGRTAYRTKGGAGPRHITFHPNGKFAYLVNELDNTVIALSYDGNGGFNQINTERSLPNGFNGYSAASAVKVSPDGRFVYASNRGHNSIAYFSISATGAIRRLGTTSTGGNNPRDFEIDPSGNYLVAANLDSDNMNVFRINKNNGSLQRVGGSVGVTKPTCLKIVDRE